MLRHVVKSIHEHEETDKEMDVETFQRLVLTARYVRNILFITMHSTVGILILAIWLMEPFQ
jgi:hypothetical protein